MQYWVYQSSLGSKDIRLPSSDFYQGIWMRDKDKGTAPCDEEAGAREEGARSRLLVDTSLSEDPAGLSHSKRSTMSAQGTE